MVKVKICGIARIEDALDCTRLGADAIGVIAEVPVDTPRKVSVDEARRIFDALPDATERFLVIMPQNLKEAIDLYESADPDVIQLHSKEPLSFVEALKGELPCKLAKTIHVQGHSSIEKALENSRYCDYLLLDTPSKVGGGSGRTHDWAISKMLVERVNVPVIMSGGLNPLNIVDAINTIKPAYVDASSGVESRPGVKDPKKVKLFIERAKSS